VVAEGADERALNRGAERGRIIGESINFTRDLANEPGAYMTPTIMADRAKQVAKEFGLSVDILDQKQMEKLGMGSLLGVARGSDEPPKLIILKYQPPRFRSSGKGELLALVGKGITFRLGRHLFEAGRKHGVDEVRHDWRRYSHGHDASNCAVEAVGAGARRGALLRELPSGKATKPGDVLRAMTGKTIEVINTDAEGRLVLADAIATQRNSAPRKSSTWRR